MSSLNPFSKQTKSPAKSTNRNRPQQRRLLLESLEGRAMLTAFVVNTLLDDPTTTAATTDTFISLREAIQAANTDAAFGDAPAGQGNGTVDSITFDPSLNTKTISLGGNLTTISSDLTLQGPGSSQLAIDGAAKYHIFVIGKGATASISGLTLQNATETQGPAVQNSGTATLTNLVVQNNTATGSTGGGGASTGGGGIWNAGTMNIFNSTVNGNTSAQNGGGVWSRGTLGIFNSTISGNTATRSGGGITATTGSGANTGPGVVDVVNSTITGNRSTTSTGAGIGTTTGKTTLHNSILAGNVTGAVGSTGTAGDVRGTIFEAKNSILGDSTTSGGVKDGVTGNHVGNAGTGTLDITKLLDTTLKNNGGPTPTHALVPNSIAIDGGDNTLAVDNSATPVALASDQRGKTRVADGNGDSTATVDIGAVEVQPLLITKFGGSILFTEKGAAIPISPIVQFSAGDSAVYNKATITAQFTKNGTVDDRISIRTSGNLSTNANNQVLYGGFAFGTFTGGSGTTPLVITLDANAGAGKVQLLLRNLTFSNVSDFPKNIPRTLNVQMVDGGGAKSALLTKPANVLRVNDAPVVATFGTNVNYKKTGSPVAISSTVVVTDVDSWNFNGGTLTVQYTSNPDANGTLAIRNYGNVTASASNLLYAGTVIGTFTGGNGNMPLVITFTANSAAPAKVQGVMRNIVYSNTQSASVVRGISTTLTDGDGGSITANSTITVL